jgi:hypothetical protein
MGSDYVTLNTGGAIAPGYGGRVSPKRTRASTKGEQVMNYEIEVQMLTFDGWEAVYTASTYAEAREILNDYRTNDRENPYRIHKERVSA